MTQPSTKRRKTVNLFVDECDHDVVVDAQDLYNQLWQIHPNSKHNPAPKPVTVRRTNLRSLTKDYVVSEKNDGQRYCLMIGRTLNGDQPYSTAVSGKREMTQCPLVATNTLAITGKTIDIYNGTLLDGEWIPNDKGGGEFIVFDCVVAGGYNSRTRNFKERCELAELIVKNIEPVGWTIRVKTFHDIKNIKLLWNNIQQGKYGKCDGLIFVSKLLPITKSTTEGTKKWKPNHMQTIDILYENGEFKCVSEDGRNIAAPITVSMNTDIPVRSGVVYEVAPGEANEWVVIKERPDKNVSNHIRTIRRTIDTLMDNVTILDIYNSIVKT